MAPRRHSVGWVALLAGLLLAGTAHAANQAAQPACGSGAANSCLNPETTGPEIHVEDGLLSDELRDELIQYLDSHEPDNALGVIMVPAPRTLAERFAGALRPLGAGSSHPARFPALSLSSFANGTGLLPGKSVGTTSKDCHSDYEVESGFNIDNVLGPTEGRVGILYLSGEGELVLVDEETGAETRQEVKPGRFMSWSNTGNKHCLATTSEARRHFLGPVVLDSAKSSFIPVVDILARPNVPCATPGPNCVDGLSCVPAGSPATGTSYCCTGSLFWAPEGKCCRPIGVSTPSAQQCCSGRMHAHACAPKGDVSCLARCKRAADHDYELAYAKCNVLRGSRAKTCEAVVAAQQSLHRAFCYAANLPRRCP